MKREITNSADVAFICDKVPIDVYDQNIRDSLMNLYHHSKKITVDYSFYTMLSAFAYGYALAKHDYRKRLNRTVNTEKPEV